MNPGYSRVYAPVLRSPLLFHHHNGLSYPKYNPAQPRFAAATTNLNFTHPSSLYRPQSQYTVQPSIPYNLQSYPYYAIPQAIVPSPGPYTSYPISPVTYASTVSSKGLSIILIATLILVAIDLMIVRPQKKAKKGPQAF